MTFILSLSYVGNGAAAFGERVRTTIFSAAKAFCAIKNWSWSFALGFCFFFAKQKEKKK